MRSFDYRRWIDDGLWRRWFLAIWLAVAVVLIWQRWAAIHWFALPDTDDNMRIMQVRGLLGGQGWFDLRQHRLDPPMGANIHWSRLVDLPIAGLILLFRPVFGGAVAERIAVAGAPLLAMGLGLYALMLAVRRLVHRCAWAPAAGIVLCAGSTMAMWKPLRIDHHGWQLALLILMVAGIADPRLRRGGVTVGLATAASLMIGLELMPYMALGGALLVLWWVADGAQAPRLKGYAASLAAGSAAGFLLFASYDNRVPMCDALSPVWLSATLAAGGLAYLLASFRMDQWPARLAAAALVGIVLAGGFALAWPDCLGAPEHLPQELKRDWFDNVREAKPIYRHGWRIALPTVALPIVGALGAIMAAIANRNGPRAMAWIMVAILSVASTTLLFWQTRAGPAAQLLAVPGATVLLFMILMPLFRRRQGWLALIAAMTAFALLSGAWASWVVQLTPGGSPSKVRRVVNRANSRCPSFPALRPIAMLPRATILTFVDLGPRLIVATQHDAIAGPYHRNVQALLDIHRSFRSLDPETAHEVMRRHGATLLLTCPGMSESTVYASDAPEGFYMQLQHGQVPGWLQPVALPKDTPFRLWRRVD